MFIKTNVNNRKDMNQFIRNILLINKNPQEIFFQNSLTTNASHV